jgi:hypothetical protein
VPPRARGAAEIPVMPSGYGLGPERHHPKAYRFRQGNLLTRPTLPMIHFYA